MKATLTVLERDMARILPDLADPAMEHMRFGGAAVSEGGDERQLLLRYVHEPAAHEYEFQSPLGVRLSPDGVCRVMTGVRGYPALVDMHNHILPQPRFSRIDDAGATVQYRILQDFSPGAIQLQLVFGPDSSFQARWTEPDRYPNWAELSEIRVVGPQHGIRRLRPWDAPETPVNDGLHQWARSRHLRTLSLIGEQALLETDGGWRPVGRLSPPAAGTVLCYVDALLGLDGQGARVDAWPPDSREVVVPAAQAPRECKGRHRDEAGFGQDLVQRVHAGEIGEIVGREREVEALTRIALKLTKNAACLVGPPGVGKTAVAEAFALRIAQGRVPPSLREAHVLEVNLAFLAAGASYKNEFEGCFKALLDQARDDHRTILFLDEVHLLCAPTNDVSQMVKADLGRGRVRCIGATTTHEWRTIEAVYQVLSAWTGMPTSHLRMAGDLEAVLARLPEELARRIFGQDEAIDTVVKALRRALILKRDPLIRRPRGVLLFVGPSGVGKTELARALAEVFYGDAERYLTGIAMSEFTEEHTIARLLGAPPGYVGYGHGGELVNALQEVRHGVLLLDEVEKAHPRVLTDALLPLIGEGIIHDMSTGELVDASNYLVVLTSNLGTNPHLRGGRTLGFGERDPEDDIREALPHEFLGRIDAVVVFRPLTEDAVQRIWSREEATLERQLTERYGAVAIVLDPLAEQIFLEQAREDVPTQGARAVRKAFERAVANRCIDIMAGADRGPWNLEITVTPTGELRFRRSRPGADGEVETNVSESKI